MTFSTNVPNAAFSPGLFPAENNTNFTRLKAIISGDHVFNDTAAENDGIHNQVTLVNRDSPSALVAGANSMFYGRTATDNVNELWFYDNVSARQLNWRELSGIVTITSSSTYVTILSIPNAAYGYIYLTKGVMAQGGTFVSNGGVVNGYSYAEKYEDTTGAGQILRLGNGANASVLNLRVVRDAATVNGVSTSGDWNYYAFWRLL